MATGSFMTSLSLLTCSNDRTASRCAELSRFSYDDPFSDPADESPDDVDAAEETAEDEEADEYDEDEQEASELLDRGEGGGDTNPASEEA